MELLYKVLSYLSVGRGGFVFELAVCEILFALFAKPRKFPWLILPAALAAYFAFGLLLPLIPAGMFSITLTTLTVFVFSVLLQWAVLKLSFHRVIFNCVAAYAVQSLSLNIREAVLILTGADGWYILLIAFVVNVLVYSGCYWAFARKGQREEMHINYVWLYIVSFLTVIVTNVMFSVFALNIGPRVEIKLTLAICCLLALMLQYSMFRRGVLDRESAVLEHLLYMEQKQHALSQETINIINIKCHDLKKQIALLRQEFGDKASDLIGDVEKAVLIYDSSVDTGNKNLDLIINEEKLYCEQNGIDLEIMADGVLLGFMAPVDIWSLFGNALRNAVEGVLEEEPPNRQIRLSVHRTGIYVCVSLTNYCTRRLNFVNGRPTTTKGDTSVHGYGILSMEHVVKKYGGNMVIDFRDNIFTVKIIFKRPE